MLIYLITTGSSHEYQSIFAREGKQEKYCGVVHISVYGNAIYIYTQKPAIY